VLGRTAERRLDMWFAEVRRLGDDGTKEEWQRLGGPYKLHVMNQDAGML